MRLLLVVAVTGIATGARRPARAAAARRRRAQRRSASRAAPRRRRRPRPRTPRCGRVACAAAATAAGTFPPGSCAAGRSRRDRRAGPRRRRRPQPRPLPRGGPPGRPPARGPAPADRPDGDGHGNRNRLDLRRRRRRDASTSGRSALADASSARAPSRSRRRTGARTRTTCGSRRRPARPWKFGDAPRSHLRRPASPAGSSRKQLTLTPGTYELYCSLTGGTPPGTPGDSHAAAGMTRDDHRRRAVIAYADPAPAVFTLHDRTRSGASDDRHVTEPSARLRHGVPAGAEPV